jgi:signal transduction histidine kinase
MMMAKRPKAQPPHLAAFVKSRAGLHLIMPRLFNGMLHDKKTSAFLCALAGSAPLLSSSALAQQQDGLRLNLFGLGAENFSRSELTMASTLVIVGVVVFAATFSIQHIRQRKRWQVHAVKQGDLIESLRAEYDRATMFLKGERQVLVVWKSLQAEPIIEGDASIVLDAPAPRRLLGFGSWLPAGMARDLEHHVEGLRQRGQRFDMVVEANNGAVIDVTGRTDGGAALLRLKDVTGDRKALRKLEGEHATLSAQAATMTQLLDAAPIPVWMRNAHDELIYVNRAYAVAVEAKDTGEALSRQTEVLERPARLAAAQSRAAGQSYSARVQTVISGRRNPVQAYEMPTANGAAGMLIDLSEFERITADLKAELQFHRDMLNRIPSAIAAFNRDRKLVFYNNAYSHFWKLDPAYLATAPDEGEILEQLRAHGQLPPQADFRAWKNAWLETYRTNEPKETLLMLPGERRFVVLATPNPQGGLTYLFEDATEKSKLETNVASLRRLQGETLDSLRDAVAVFGSDGRLKLSNPAFKELWDIDLSHFKTEPRIDHVIKAMQRPDAASHWEKLHGVITGINDVRRAETLRLTLDDDLSLDAAILPLPDGGTLVTFADISANVRAENALRDRNEALLATESFRNAFLRNVSFELREPLTAVIGFGEMLAAGVGGTLAERQQGYVDAIVNSTRTVLGLLDDITDISQIEAGMTDMDRQAVDLGRIVEQSLAPMAARAAEQNITLRKIGLLDGTRIVNGDSRRLAQAITSLLEAALDASLAGETIEIGTELSNGRIALNVTDMGGGRRIPGLPVHDGPASVQERGANFRLTVAKTIFERHGGSFEMHGDESHGLKVRCTLPAQSVG